MLGVQNLLKSLAILLSFSYTYTIFITKIHVDYGFVGHVAVSHFSTVSLPAGKSLNA
jgi:hypothetical protein